MTARPSPLGILAWTVAALLVAGCSLLTRPETPPTRYFVLTGQRTASLSMGSDDGSEVAIGVGPFTFPNYLERPQMVTRNDPNQLVFSQFSRWAEPVASGFLRVLAEDIGWKVGTSQVVLFPWYQTPLDYQVKGEVLRFEANADGTVELDCIWTIYDLVEKKYRLTRYSQLQREVATGNPDEITAALSALVGELAQAIAAEPILKRAHPRVP